MSICIVFDFFRSKCSGKNERKFLLFKQCIPASTISGKFSQCIPPEITKKPKVLVLLGVINWENWPEMT